MLLSYNDLADRLKRLSFSSCTTAFPANCAFTDFKHMINVALDGPTPPLLSGDETALLRPCYLRFGILNGSTPSDPRLIYLKKPSGQDAEVVDRYLLTAIFWSCGPMIN